MSNQLTIVIPVYNRAHIVGRTLASIAAQTAPGFDVVLVDNASSDGSLAVLESWRDTVSSAGRPVKVISEQEPGAAAARNAGLREVTTPWVLFFDSDDVMLPRHVERALKAMAANPDTDVIGWDTRHIGNGVKRFYTRDLWWNNLFEGSFSTQRWCARTSLIMEAGGWDPTMRLWDDIELGARIIARGPRLAHAGPEITVEVYPQEESISTNRGGDYLERMEAPLRSIAAQMPERNRFWADYVRAIAAGNTRRGATGEVAQSAEHVLARILARTSSPVHRALLRGVYAFRRFGGRGQNRILKLILNLGLGFLGIG